MICGQHDCGGADVCSGCDSFRHGHPHVELRRGIAFVIGSNVPVYRLWQWHARGIAVATLFERYPKLTRSQILDALSYANDVGAEQMTAQRERIDRSDSLRLNDEIPNAGSVQKSIKRS